MSNTGSGAGGTAERDGEWEMHPEEGVPVPKQKLFEPAALRPTLHKGLACMPGQKICVANEYFEPGEGAYEFGNRIYASVIGSLHVQEFPDQELTVVSVKRTDGTQPFASPHVGAIVTCTVTSRTRKFARCLITHVGSVKLDDSIRGIVRREYITDKQRDMAEIETSFGVGDTLLARIVGIGDGDFIMSTAEDGLGVATAVSKAGYYMVPVGWSLMECPKTKETQSRKVAKIIQDKNVEYWHRRNLGGGPETLAEKKGSKGINKSRSPLPQVQKVGSSSGEDISD